MRWTLGCVCVWLRVWACWNVLCVGRVVGIASISLLSPLCIKAFVRSHSQRRVLSGFGALSDIEEWCKPTRMCCYVRQALTVWKSTYNSVIALSKLSVLKLKMLTFGFGCRRFLAEANCPSVHLLQKLFRNYWIVQVNLYKIDIQYGQLYFTLQQYSLNAF